jgi:hypothetical protein
MGKKFGSDGEWVGRLENRWKGGGWNTYIFKFSSVYFISFGGIFLSLSLTPTYFTRKNKMRRALFPFGLQNAAWENFTVAVAKK